LQLSNGVLSANSFSRQPVVTALTLAILLYQAIGTGAETARYFSSETRDESDQGDFGCIQIRDL